MGKKIEKDIGQRIREIREDKNKNQKVIADALHVSTSVVSRIESGEREIKLWELEIIAEALGVGLDELISIDKISETIDSFMDLFKIITTSKEYPIEKDGVIDADNLLLKTDKECIVLTATKSVFDIVRKISEIKIIASKFPDELKGKEYELAEIQKLKAEYKRFIKLKKESYFLISKDELAELIEENVSRRIELYKLLNENQD